MSNILPKVLASEEKATTTSRRENVLPTYARSNKSVAAPKYFEGLPLSLVYESSPTGMVLNCRIEMAGVLCLVCAC